MGVDWESKLTFGFTTQGIGVGYAQQSGLAGQELSGDRCPIKKSGGSLWLFGLIAEGLDVIKLLAET